MDTIINYLKCVYYVYYLRNLPTTFSAAVLSEQAIQTAKKIRGAERGPSIIMHGVMPRSGTVFTGSLLGLHPDLYSYPNKMWEIPFLRLTEEILDLQKVFFKGYKKTDGKIGKNDFLPLFGASFLAYLHSFVPEEKRVLLKEPDVSYLNYFYSVFPHENLLLLIRDGRDVISSTIRTRPQVKFHKACMQWDTNARMALRFHQESYGKVNGYLMVKFEDVVRDPYTFVRQACHRFGLDETVYPYEKIKSIPIYGSSVLRDQGEVTWKGIQKPKGFSPIGRWKDWPAGKKRIFKWIAGKTLMDLGYCENLDW